jgi:hypothetical protein
MMARLPQRTRADFIEILARAFQETLPDTIEEAREEVRAIGLDPKALSRELATVALEALQHSRPRPSRGRSSRNVDSLSGGKKR